MRGLGCVVMAWMISAVIGGSAAASPTAAFERTRTSVVAISYFIETSFMSEVREVGGRDLGVVVGDNMILLNGSVVTASSTGAQPHGFRVRFVTGEERTATLVGRDEFVNVAFLRFEGTRPKGVTTLRFDTGSPPRVGESVFAVGLLPENLEPMARLVEGRVIANIERPKAFALTDLPAEIALGGPVFTTRGRVVGVLSELGDAGPSFAASFAAEGDAGATGLILDGETLTKLVAEPPRTGQSRRAWLGITLQALEPDMAAYWNLDTASGIVVNSVVDGSPAAAAGLREGDIVLTVNGAPVPVSRDEHVPVFIEQIGSSAVGSRLRLGVFRDRERLETTVDLTAAPKTRLDAEKYENTEFEISVRELVFQDQRAYDLDPGFRGVVVTKVEEGGWAGVGGLSSGDLIQKVDDREIASPEDLKQVLEDATKQKRRKLVFFVQRSGRTQFVTVQPNWSGQS